ncbi:MAG: cation:proton antiporter subunit C [Clostridiales bacterium]|nr:cation:proton antiporter subunit C [Clostridiales bacterium]
MIIIFFISIAMVASIVGLGVSKNIIKSIMFLNLLQANIILLFISFNYHEELVPPIFNGNLENFSDPLPQALMITAIVIGASVTALALMFSIKIFHHFGSLEWDIIKKRID